MADTHPADESGNGCGVEDISDHAVRLALVEAALRATCHDAARILAAMLEEREPFADLCGSIQGGIMEEEA